MTSGDLNGINTIALADTMAAIEKEPILAAFKWRARNRWVSGGENHSAIEGYFGACEEHVRSEPFHLVNDEPSILLGTDKAANPFEYILHALAGCVTTSLIAHATARGVAIHEVETRLVGDWDARGFLGLDASVRNGFASVRVDVSIKGNAETSTLAELVDIARQRSPIFDIVSGRTPIEFAVSAESTTNNVAQHGAA